MLNRTKIILGVTLLIIAFLAFVIVNGLRLMAVEDHYGDLQNVYFQSETGDLIIDNQGRSGTIEKYEDKIFVAEEACMKDLYAWANFNQEEVKFKVYRLSFPETATTNPTYSDILNLIKQQKLEPIISN